MDDACVSDAGSRPSSREEFLGGSSRNPKHHKGPDGLADQSPESTPLLWLPTCQAHSDANLASQGCEDWTKGERMARPPGWSNSGILVWREALCKLG